MLVFVGRLTTIPKQEEDSKINLSTDRTNNVPTVGEKLSRMNVEETLHIKRTEGH